MDRNPNRAGSDWPAVVVAGAHQTGIVLMRNLARRGLSVFCIGSDRRQPGFRTIYGKAVLCPDPLDDPPGWRAFMFQLADRIGGKPALIPSSDLFVSAMAQHAEELSKRFLFCRASVSTQALLATKQRQYGIAAAHGMPVPATQFVRSPEEVSAFGAGARFPCLLKPLHCRQWERVPPSHPFYFRKVVVVSTAGELEANYELSSQIDPQVVVQEVIEGPDTAKLVYLSCYGVSGERLGACLVREVRTAPIYFGSASLVVPMHDPDVDALCDGFLRSIGYSGLCEIELKRDSRDGCVRMIEANPRYSVTADAAPYLGVDLGWLHYLNLIGQPVAPISQKSRDLRHIVLVRDFSCFRDYLRAGLLTWGQLIQSYRRPVVFFDFDLRDWRVTAATCVTLLRLLLGPPLRRFFPKRVAPAPSGPAGR